MQSAIWSRSNGATVVRIQPKPIDVSDERMSKLGLKLDEKIIALSEMMKCKYARRMELRESSQWMDIQRNSG